MTAHTDNQIETLVALKAQIAQLQTRAKIIEAEFKLKGEGTYSSHQHNLNVTRVVSHPVDWKSLARDLNPSDYYIQKHTGDKTTLRLTINVKKKEVA